MLKTFLCWGSQVLGQRSFSRALMKWITNNNSMSVKFQINHTNLSLLFTKLWYLGLYLVILKLLFYLAYHHDDWVLIIITAVTDICKVTSMGWTLFSDPIPYIYYNHQSGFPQILTLGSYFFTCTLTSYDPSTHRSLGDLDAIRNAIFALVLLNLQISYDNATRS